MDFYKDYELNRRANRALDYINKYLKPMETIGASISGNKINEKTLENAHKIYQDINDNGLDIADELLKNTLPDLDYIRSQVDSNEENYLELTEALAITTCEIIKIPLRIINDISKSSNFHKDGLMVAQSKDHLAHATRLVKRIANLDIPIGAQQSVAKTSALLSQTERNINSKSGCFIATCVYGDYNSKEVLILRSYRDNSLAKSRLGILFINLYYRTSPVLVKSFGENKTFIKCAKYTLSKIISLLK